MDLKNMDLTAHALYEFIDRDGWVYGICGCGWETPPCPASEEAANFWGQHLLEKAQEQQ